MTRQRNIVGRLFLVMIMAIFFFFMTLFNFQQLRNGRVVVYLTSTEYLWSTQQLEFELHRLIAAMKGFRDPSTDLEPLRLRLDILWSRLPPLLHGREGSYLRETGDLGELSTTLETQFRRLAELLETEPIDRAALDRRIVEFEALAGPVRALTVAALHQTGQTHTELASRMHDIYVANVIASCGLGLATAALITLLVLQLRDSRRRLALEEEANDRIEHLAHHDVLTGLPNRRLFNDRLNQALAGARRQGTKIALHFLDIDHFKSINDALAHTSGDRLLQEASRRLVATIRDTDTLARIAGDEFAVVQSGVMAPSGVAELGERLVRAFAEPFQINGRRIEASASIGSTLFPDDGPSAERLFANADVALHRAKSNGRAQCTLFDEAMMAKELRRRKLATRLDHVCELGELSVCYQPKFSTRSARLSGFEALLRWDRGSQPAISPAEFVPIAESTGAIVPIGEWILETACRDLARWQCSDGEFVSLAVNLSAVQLRKVDCVRRFRAIVEASRIDPRALEFEITETSLLSNEPSVVATIKGLHEMGSRICLDDFGTGFSSLSHLQAFPLDTMKLDRSFVSRLDEPRTRCICEGITDLGHRLGLEIVGEGAETAWQYDELVRMGCDQVQGFFLGRPMPFDQLRRLVDDGGVPARRFS